MVRIDWSGFEQRQWDEWLSQAAGAIQQHWAYGQALGEKATPLRAVVRAEQSGGHSLPLAIAQFLVRRTAGVFSIALCSRGPVWIACDSPDDKARIISTLKKGLPVRQPRIVFFSPDDPGDVESIPPLTRVLTGAATVRLDLTQAPDALRAAMHPKWRNRLVAAEASPLRVQRSGVKPAQYNWLLEREGLQRQQRGYHALPADFVPAFQRASTDPANAMLMLRADIGKDAVAAMMFLVHGSVATYHVGWADEAGRKHSAHNLLLWHAMLALKERGLRALDLGGVNTQRGAGIARFKIGSGGQVQTFCGTYT